MATGGRRGRLLRLSAAGFVATATATTLGGGPLALNLAKEAPKERQVLVTGGNKGIGLAICKGLLEEGCYVYLGSRDVSRGEAAKSELVKAISDPSVVERCTVVQLDVTEGISIERAVATITKSSGGKPLYGIVNNAGGADTGAGSAAEFKAWVDLNLLGPKRVTDAFLPLLSPTDGRIVMISSAAGPSFVSKCSGEVQEVLCSPRVTWGDVEKLVATAYAVVNRVPLPDDVAERESAFATMGLGNSYYGFSKACLNAYTVELARDHPNLHINACTPGFIETDLTRPMAESRGKLPSEMGMKSPDDGAKSALYLMLSSSSPGSGRYYGSDSVRSPLHCYRGPGTPKYNPKLVARCAVAPLGNPCKGGQAGGGVTGTITLTQISDDETHVEYDVRGLPPNSEHGFHIHEKADFSNGCLSAGPHYNPFKRTHGAPDDEERHVGDLGNLVADGAGVAKGVVIDRLIKIDGPYSVVGRSFMVHADRDDLGRGDNSEPSTVPPVNGKCSKVTGNAGARVACGEIVLDMGSL